MFDTDAYHPGTSVDIKGYRSVVWANQKEVFLLIIVYVAPTFYETTTDHLSYVIYL
jgi:hypothetical protein